MSVNNTDGGDEKDPIAMADQMLKKRVNRTISPSGDTMEASPGLSPGVASSLEGQLGPDELPAPEEVILNNEAKLAH